MLACEPRPVIQWEHSGLHPLCVDQSSSPVQMPFPAQLFQNQLDRHCYNVERKATEGDHFTLLCFFLLTCLVCSFCRPQQDCHFRLHNEGFFLANTSLEQVPQFCMQFFLGVYFRGHQPFYKNNKKPALCTKRNYIYIL